MVGSGPNGLAAAIALARAGLAAMVAYNLLLSIFPVALVALFIAGRILRSAEVQASVLLDLEQLFPSASESTLSEAVRRLQESSTTTGILAIVAAQRHERVQKRAAKRAAKDAAGAPAPVPAPASAGSQSASTPSTTRSSGA